MKLAIVWKWWAWKTTLSVFLTQLLAQHKNILAIDADSNKNLIDYLWFSDHEELAELWDLKPDIFKLAWSESSEYDRKYAPKNWKYVFATYPDDPIIQKVTYWEWNIRLIQLWSPRECRVWVTGMCPYNETIKVYLANLEEQKDEIVFVDFAAGSEVAWKWIVASMDNIIIPLEPNSKNLDVAKDIFKTLKLIDFKNVYFIANKVRNDEDLEYIKKYFWEDITFLWSIPFSKEIMKMDIKWNLNAELLPLDIKNNLDLIVKNILQLESNKHDVIKRLQQLDILKWDKKVH